MKITDFSPAELEGALYCCAFSSCSDCPLSENSDLVGKALCNPNADTSNLFKIFADYLAKHVLAHRGSEAVETLILSAIKDLYHIAREN